MNRRTSKRLSRQLVEAAGYGSAARVVELIRAGADPGGRNADGTTALYAASVQGNPGGVRALLGHGADPNAHSGGPTDGTPLCAAACWGHVETVRALLAGGADPGLREDDGQGPSPLEWAVREEHEDVARLLQEALSTTAVGGA
ncbi:ankyrin repeat domain-containing protein [Streptomyces sp. NPDC048272]|uniref:ankyrin repeat domain-containing protein n=1 Tax=Streptomyces sp. NPDC048272 TaxID=3154616 RepID=UPI003417C0E8